MVDADDEWDFFLSHAGADKELAEQLYDHLCVGSRVFLDSRSLRPGDDWGSQLTRAQQRSRVTLVLVSTHTEEAYYQRDEVAAAISLSRKTSGGHLVVPIYVDIGSDDASVPNGLRLRHGITLGQDCSVADASSMLLRQLQDSSPRGSSASTGDSAAAGEAPPQEAATSFSQAGVTVVARNSQGKNIVFGNSQKADGKIVMRLSFVIKVDFDTDLMAFRVDYHQGWSEKLYWDRGGQIRIGDTVLRIADGLLDETWHMKAGTAYVVNYSQVFYGRNDVDGLTTWTDFPKLRLSIGFSNGQTVQNVAFLNPGGELTFTETGWCGPCVH